MSLDLQDAITDAFTTDGFDTISEYGFGLQPDEAEELLTDTDIARLIHWIDLPITGSTLDTASIIKTINCNFYTFARNSKDCVTTMHSWLQTNLQTEVNELGRKPSAPFDYPSTNATIRFWEFREVGAISTTAERWGNIFRVIQPMLIEARKL